MCLWILCELNFLKFSRAVIGSGMRIYNPDRLPLHTWYAS